MILVIDYLNDIVWFVLYSWITFDLWCIIGGPSFFALYDQLPLVHSMNDNVV